MVVALIAYDYLQGQAQLVRDSKSRARTLISAVDRELASAQAALLTLATSPHLMTDDFPGFYAQAKDVLRSQKLNNIVLIDATLQQRVNTLVPFGAPLPVERNPVWQRAFEARQPVVTDVFFGPVARKPLIAIGVPVFRDNANVYFLAAGILPERLSEVLTQENLPPDWIGTIFDGAGTIVARTHQPERFVGQKGAAALIARVQEVAEGTLETTTVEGIRVLSIFSRSATSMWTAAIGVPTASLTSGLRHALWWLIACALMLLSSSLALAWLIGGRIAASIHGLVEPALALGRGETVRVSSLGIREVNDVGRALSEVSRVLAEAQHRANHDVLTGLANRTLFNEILRQQLAVCQREGSNLTVAFVDLDDFKSVNDVHGHACGDELLRAVATRLKNGIRVSDVVARLGGDEFAVVFVHVGLRAAASVCEKLVENLGMPYSIGSIDVRISASIGIAGYPDSATSVEALSQLADEAMYKAKNAGKGRYALASR